jgi:hypothetical protein
MMIQSFITASMVKTACVMQYCMDGQADFNSIFAAKPILTGDVTIVLCTRTMRDWAQKHIPGRVLIMDSTFGVNRLGYSLFTVMAVGHNGAGLPVAFMITKTETAENISTGLKQFRDFLDEKTPSAHLAVRPSTTLTDDSTAEQNALGYDAMLVQLCICRTNFNAYYVVQYLISIVIITVTVWFV